MQELQQLAEFNGLIGDLFKNAELIPYRNKATLYWMRRGKILLKNSISELLKIKELSKIEIIFLEKISKIADNSGDDGLIKFSYADAKEILGLSMESIIEREKIIQEKLIYEEIKTANPHEISFLLNSCSKLLKLIKYRLIEGNIGKNDFDNVRDISFSLMRTYLYLSNNLDEESIKSNIVIIKKIWREYHPISGITFQR
jgi:hypothetical protein